MKDIISLGSHLSTICLYRLIESLKKSILLIDGRVLMILLLTKAKSGVEHLINMLLFSSLRRKSSKGFLDFLLYSFQNFRELSFPNLTRYKSFLLSIADACALKIKLSSFHLPSNYLMSLNWALHQILFLK